MVESAIIRKSQSNQIYASLIVKTPCFYLTKYAILLNPLDEWDIFIALESLQSQESESVSCIKKIMARLL